MKKVKLGLIAAITFALFSVSVKAASLGISASTTSTTVGNSVIITINASDMAGQFSISSSDGGVLSGGTSSTWIENSKQTFTFKANSAGTATVTVKPVDVADFSGNPYTSSKSVSMTVSEKKPVILSSDNNLTSLSVDGAELNPEFNRDTLEYSVELAPDTTSININATGAAGSSITGNGTREVTDGDNRLEIIVTAENGTTKTYVINAIVKEYNPIEVSVDDKKYTVVRKKSLLTAPQNYIEATVKIGEEEVPAFTSDVTGYTLVGLKDTEGNISLFVYDEKKKNYKLYKEYTFNRIILYPMVLNKKDIPAGYKKNKIVYNDEEIIAYKLNDDSKYSLIYGMNVETGKISLYMYDSNEDTLQIYNQEEIQILNKNIEQYKKYLITSLIVIGILFLSFFVSITKLIKYRSIKKLITNSEASKHTKDKKKRKKEDSDMAKLDDEEINVKKIK